jgi:hypothetical protein
MRPNLAHSSGGVSGKFSAAFLFYFVPNGPAHSEYLFFRPLRLYVNGRGEEGTLSAPHSHRVYATACFLLKTTLTKSPDAADRLQSAKSVVLASSAHPALAAFCPELLPFVTQWMPFLDCQSTLKSRRIIQCESERFQFSFQSYSCGLRFMQLLNRRLPKPGHFRREWT